MKVKYLYHALEMFIIWTEEGRYDFCSLPYTLKSQVDPHDFTLLRSIPSHYGNKHCNEKTSSNVVFAFTI